MCLRNADKKAAIGYVYEDSTPVGDKEKQKDDDKEESEESEEEEDIETVDLGLFVCLFFIPAVRR